MIKNIIYIYITPFIQSVALPHHASEPKSSSTTDYPIQTYRGTKAIVLTSTSFLGDRNSFMGYAWISMGCICAALGLIFLVVNCIKHRYVGVTESVRVLCERLPLVACLEWAISELGG